MDTFAEEANCVRLAWRTKVLCAFCDAEGYSQRTEVHYDFMHWPMNPVHRFIGPADAPHASSFAAPRKTPSPIGEYSRCNMRIPCLSSLARYLVRAQTELPPKFCLSLWGEFIRSR